MAKPKSDNDNSNNNNAKVSIPPPDFPIMEVWIVGTAPLACNAFPDKLKGEMRGARSVDTSVQNAPGGKKSRKSRPARDFQEEYENALYPLDGGGYGFPAIAFKKAIVGACRQTSNLDMTLANRIIFVNATHYSKGAGCVQIVGKPKMAEVVVRLSGPDRPPDLRYRGEFFPWKAKLLIEFNAAIITKEGIMNLLQYAGKCEGVGEQRPSSRKSAGDFGQFRLAQKGD